MGVTIHYRGSIDDLGRIEEFEDRVTDLVFALGGRATVWRSFADHDPSRVVRGLIVEMAPGQESFSLLVSPEGNLLSLVDIETAEKGPFPEPPYVFVKTQFGSIQGHISIVHILDAIQQHFCSNLDVSDEGGYYEDRDVAKLAGKMHRNAMAIRAMSQGLEEFGLSAEAAEDPNILATRVERIAKLVQKKMQGDHSQSPSNQDEEPSMDHDWFSSTLEDEVGFMDRLHRKSQLRGERMTRRIDEAMAEGKTHSEAWDQAMKEEGLNELPADDDSQVHGFDDEPVGFSETIAWDPSARDPRHPALELATQFLLEAMALAKEDSGPGSFASVLQKGAMEIVGGLAQATCDEHDSRIDRALSISQLKRALKGHAFARGAVFGLHSSSRIDNKSSDHFHNQLAGLLKSIHELSSEAWDEPDFS